MKCDLTRNLILSLPVTKVEYIYTFTPVFGYKIMGLNMLYLGIWCTRYLTIWFSERRVFGSNTHEIFCWLQFFVGIEKESLTAYSLIAAIIVNHYHPQSQPGDSLLEQLQRGVKSQSRKRLRLGWGILL